MSDAPDPPPVVKESLTVEPEPDDAPAKLPVRSIIAVMVAATTCFIESALCLNSIIAHTPFELSTAFLMFLTAVVTYEFQGNINAQNSKSK